MLFDFFPIILFFAAFKLSGNDMIIATQVGIAATFLQVAIHWLKHRAFEKMHLITLVLISVFGGITIYLDNPLYIQWKTTILEWVFALAFLGSHYIGKDNFVKRMMGQAMTAPDDIWAKLNFAWVGFFTLMCFVNLYVIYNFSQDIWVNFKTFGMLGMTFVFIIAQGIVLSRYVNASNVETGESGETDKVE
jgi:intracellular septation protein